MEIGSRARLPLTRGAGGVQRLGLTLALSRYEHTHDVMTGQVRPEGIEVVPLVLPIEEIAYRHFKNGEFDCAETSLAKYIGTVASDAPPFVGIPVFPARLFRFSSIYLRRDSGIRSPGDFVGKVVGVPEWAQTAGVYMRGALAEYFGVALDGIRWVQAGVNEPGRLEKLKLDLPPSLAYESRPDRCLDEMLLSGEIDAAFSARPPKSFLTGDPRIVRLFPDFRAEESVYFKTTGVFPILHIMSLRREVLEHYPWAAMSLFNAFERAKDAAVARMLEIETSRLPLPWGVAHAIDMAEMMGGDIWPYGVVPNLTTLNAFCRFAHDQYLTPRLLTVDDLFPEEVIGRYRV